MNELPSMFMVNGGFLLRCTDGFCHFDLRIIVGAIDISSMQALQIHCLADKNQMQNDLKVRSMRGRFWKSVKILILSNWIDFVELLHVNKVEEEVVRK